jgi:hypothetical protein
VSVVCEEPRRGPRVWCGKQEKASRLEDVVDPREIAIEHFAGNVLDYLAHDHCVKAFIDIIDGVVVEGGSAIDVHGLEYA